MTEAEKTVAIGRLRQLVMTYALPINPQQAQIIKQQIKAIVRDYDYDGDRLQPEVRIGFWNNLMEAALHQFSEELKAVWRGLMEPALREM